MARGNLVVRAVLFLVDQDWSPLYLLRDTYTSLKALLWVLVNVDRNSDYFSRPLGRNKLQMKHFLQRPIFTSFVLNVIYHFPTTTTIIVIYVTSRFAQSPPVLRYYVLPRDLNLAQTPLAGGRGSV